MRTVAVSTFDQGAHNGDINVVDVDSVQLVNDEILTLCYTLQYGRDTFVDIWVRQSWFEWLKFALDSFSELAAQTVPNRIIMCTLFSPPPFSRSMFNYYLALGFHQIPQNSELNKEIPVIHVLRIIVLSVVSVLCYHALYVYACILSLSFYCYSCSVIVIVHKCKKNCSLL